MKCPSSGSDEILIHSKGTFEDDGLVCMNCGKVFEGKPDETVPKHIKIKGWRRAWWESNPELERQMHERWLYT
jgi:transposase-like protein